MSLSQEPVFSLLQQEFVCGYRDITGEPYAGRSGVHDTTGNAIQTTNGAGPHNTQLFMLAADGTVLHCLPGYWNPSDLAHEMELAYQLNQVWQDPHLSRGQKNEMFRTMHAQHLQEHSPLMVARSRMQSFDQKYEAKHRPYTSDTIRNPQLLAVGFASKGVKGPLPQQAFKTTDEIMHQRLSKRPFQHISQFDVGSYCDYGRPFYDKKEDLRVAGGMGANMRFATQQQMMRRRMQQRPNAYVANY